MTYPKVNLLRYLVREKGVSVHEMKDLKTALGALEAVLHAAPAPVDNDGFLPEGEFGIGDSYSGDYSEEESMDSREEYEANEKHGDSSADGSVVDAVSILFSDSHHTTGACMLFHCDNCDSRSQFFLKILVVYI
jgi:hypothetical protein